MRFDEHHARLDAVDELILLAFFLGPRAGAQSKRRGVGDANRVADIFGAKTGKRPGRKARRKLRESPRDIAQHRGSVEISGAVQRLSAGE